jgi:hypothetical protein
LLGLKNVIYFELRLFCTFKNKSNFRLRTKLCAEVHLSLTQFLSIPMVKKLADFKLDDVDKKNAKFAIKLFLFVFVLMSTNNCAKS